ncbi:50S ribosomal protein L25/general stress protein Ctc [Aquirufa rosea]|uniref:Large ribosomal subunit protein bL25 n=1 Tax=Aquirufa rosea TaxID=2509241 RepID=A0A4Q1C2I7_9BACT|nr:50S ribosomal protein L25/general stress protein Ctc [Aquirufa rosea]RXK52325.1 50S ribosomal protein L25/general stress protein Ctc [Aquirufa rosea]
MKKLEIVGYKRANLGTKSAKDLRSEALAPCVLYGGKEQVHFAVPMILFRELLYSSDVYEVALNIEGDTYRAILQDAQFHPVNEMILHVDFLEIVENKPIKIDVPIKIVGNSPGVIKGGKMIQKLRKVTLKGLAENIPDFVTADISGLDLGQTVKVNKLEVTGCEILNPMSNPVATIDIPRALRGKLTA